MPPLPQQTWFPGMQQPGIGLSNQPQQQNTWAPGMQQPPTNWPKAQPAQLPQNLPFKKVYYKTLKRGALVSFSYSLWKNDPYPLLVCCDTYPNYIRGVNLHYLTLRYMKSILKNYCGKDFFSYRYIKTDPFIVNSFRTYKKAGIRQLKILDCDLINSVLTNVRSFNPQEMEFVRLQIQQQLQKQINPKAEELAQQYQQQMLQPQPQQGFVPLDKGMRQDARRAFVPQTQQQLDQDLQNWQAGQQGNI